MKNLHASLGAVTALMLALSPTETQAQSSAFTYQGRLVNPDGSVVTGKFDLRFSVFDALTNGLAIGSAFTTNGLVVTAGNFTVPLNFGAATFSGADRWLEIAVKTNGAAAWSVLNPRQPVTSLPYAIRAAEAGRALTVAPNAITGSALQSGAVDSSKIADASIAAADLSDTIAWGTFWRLGGNTGTTPGAQFLGTTDNQPLELKVNGARILKLEPNATGPNVIGGFSGNTVAGAAGAVVMGGGPGRTNTVTANFGGVLSGGQNRASGTNSVVAGGLGNAAEGPFSAVGGGQTNRAGLLAAVAGGAGNEATGVAAAIPGGLQNQATGSGSLAAGSRAKALHDGAFVWADATGADFGSSSNNQFLIRAAGGVGVGTNRPQSMLHVAGTVTAERFVGNVQMTGISLPGTTTQGSVLTSDTAGTGAWSDALRLIPTSQPGPMGFPVAASPNIVAGAPANFASNGVVGATISGGGIRGLSIGITYNVVGGDYGTVAGGAGNIAGGDFSTVAGGYRNQALGNYSFAAGRQAQASHPGTFVWADSQAADFVSSGRDQFLVRAGGGVGIGTATPDAQLAIAPPPDATALTVSGSLPGNWTTPLAYIQNTNTQGNSGPALRLLSKANSPDAVLNVGSTGTGKLAAFGNAAGEVANLDTNGLLTLKAGVIVDANSANSNLLSYGLQFGLGSGEGIFSRRRPGANQYGLDLVTYWAPRISIANNGNVGIGTTEPVAKLDIALSNARVQFTNELVPAINVTGGGIPGVLRFRNSFEVWPSLDTTREGKLDVRDTNGSATITLSGTGVATVKVLEITGGSDLAEPFETKETEVDPGSVMVIDDAHPGRLTLSGRAYDTRVAGVVSGANGVQPGISLRQHGVLDQGRNIALTGRVYVKADARHGAIKPGDLLTTSDTPGHAMRVADHARAQGAILGKAMSGLSQGTGHVLVLVTLQ